MNLTLELTTEQVINLIQQMPPEVKFTVLKELAKQARSLVYPQFLIALILYIFL